MSRISPSYSNRSGTPNEAAEEFEEEEPEEDTSDLEPKEDAVYGPMRVWKLGEDRDPDDPEDWRRRDLWLGQSGRLYFEHPRRQRGVPFFGGRFVWDMKVRRLRPHETCQEFAISIRLALPHWEPTLIATDDKASLLLLLENIRELQQGEHGETRTAEQLLEELKEAAEEKKLMEDVLSAREMHAKEEHEKNVRLEQELYAKDDRNRELEVEIAGLEEKVQQQKEELKVRNDDLARKTREYDEALRLAEDQKRRHHWAEAAGEMKRKAIVKDAEEARKQNAEAQIELASVRSNQVRDLEILNGMRAQLSEARKIAMDAQRQEGQFNDEIFRLRQMVSDTRAIEAETLAEAEATMEEKDEEARRRRAVEDENTALHREILFLDQSVTSGEKMAIQHSLDEVSILDEEMRLLEKKRFEEDHAFTSRMRFKAHKMYPLGPEQNRTWNEGRKTIRNTETERVKFQAELEAEAAIAKKDHRAWENWEPNTNPRAAEAQLRMKENSILPSIFTSFESLEKIRTWNEEERDRLHQQQLRQLAGIDQAAQLSPRSDLESIDDGDNDDPNEPSIDQEPQGDEFDEFLEAGEGDSSQMRPGTSGEASGSSAGEDTLSRPVSVGFLGDEDTVSALDGGSRPATGAEDASRPGTESTRASTAGDKKRKSTKKK